jgi:hydroxymethylbilane synthase
LLAALDGSCRTPIAALAEIDAAGRLGLHARIIRPDGTECHEARLSGAIADAARIGREVGERLRAEAGPGFFDLPIPEGTPV